MIRESFQFGREPSRFSFTFIRDTAPNTHKSSSYAHPIISGTSDAHMPHCINIVRHGTVSAMQFN